jgi:cytoskeletal protein CcmA (bactofilin family)
MGGKALLLVTIGFAFILGLVAVNLTEKATQSIGNMSFYAAATESHNLTITGANVGLARLYQDTSWSGSITQSFPGTGGENEGQMGNLSGSFTATLTRPGATTALLRSVSTYQTHSNKTLNDTVEVFFDTKRYNSFTLYAWMTDFEGNHFWISGDTIWGRAHTNGRFHINGRPVFMDKVTTAKGFDPKPGTGTNDAEFRNGYETGTASIDFPNNFQELIDATDPSLGGTGRFFNTDIWVSLSGGSSASNDGWAYIRLANGGPVVDSIQLNGSGFNGALVGAHQVHVEGTLDGALTVGSLEDIRIENDVIYENRDYANSDDVLGMVSQGDIIVANTTPNQNDCRIDGSVFCLTGSFEVEDYNHGSPRGALRLAGSIVQDDRGNLASYSGGELRSGYYKRFYYDERLADTNFRPPFFPGYWVRTFAIVNWWENVRIPEIAE